MAGPNVNKYYIAIEVMKEWTTNPNPNRMDGMAGGDDVLHNLLAYRRYKPPVNQDESDAWTVPDDRKVNPWDVNEIDPAKTGGTIPGPVLECNVGPLGVGEVIEVHFKNKDDRHTLPAPATPSNGNPLPPTFGQCAHSLHPHGVVFSSEYDGAYPLSRPDQLDPRNKITLADAERSLWDMVNVKGDFKQGDRVPPGGTFIYTWSTFGWPTTSGVWLYHDHSVMDSLNTLRGAIGFIVVHNQNDESDFAQQDLPDGGPNGDLHAKDANGVDRILKTPKKALYLQLFHELKDDTDMNADFSFIDGHRGSYMNGRRNLGSTPTFIAGTDTLMRFGVGAMNLLETHTFHIHGHRWVIPGPSGTHVAGETPPGTGIQVSTMNQAVSQFEDTKILGPGNTFVMAIQHGSFMGPPLVPPASNQKGEFHMHCHLLDHMRSDGMMGSLLVTTKDDEFAPQSGDISMEPGGGMGPGM